MTTTPQDEIAASVAAFRDLGPGYDQAVAESLVERIGTEIDRRIAEATAGKPAGKKAVRPEQQTESSHMDKMQFRIGLGSIGAAVLVTAIVVIAGAATSSEVNGNNVHGPGIGELLLTALIWLVVGAINIAYARRSR